MIAILAALAVAAGRNPSGGGEEIIVLALAAELTLVLYLTRAEMNAWILVFTWALITTTTWVLLIMTLNWAASRTGDLLRHSEGWLLLALLEGLVVLVEGAALKGLSLLPSFRKQGGRSLGWGRAFGVSAIANLVSFAIPVLAVLLLSR